VVDDIEDDVFQDSSVQHYLDITGHVPSYPSGTIVSGDCMIQGGVFECMIICERTSSIHDLEYNFTCQMIIPPIDYVGSPFFYPNSRDIILTQNMFSIKHTYNEGPENKTDVYNFSVDEIKINVTTHCGEGGCEAGFDESQSDCCRDCGCSGYGDDYFCYTGKNPNGACLLNSSIILEITEFEPDPTECTIFQEGESCRITTATIADVEIINPPTGVTLIDAFYSAGDQEDTPMDCRESLKKNHYICPFALEDIPLPQPSALGIVNVSVRIVGVIDYSIGDVKITQNIEGESGIDIEKAYSYALQNCLDMRQNIEDQISALEKTQSETNTYANIFMTIGNFYMSLYATSQDVTNLIFARLCYAKAEEEIEKFEEMEKEQEAEYEQMRERAPMCDALTVPDLAALEDAGLTEIPPP